MNCGHCQAVCPNKAIQPDNDLIPPACNRSSEIRDLLDLPEDRKVYASITLGYPRHTFKRSIPRELAEIRSLQ